MKINSNYNFFVHGFIAGLHFLQRAFFTSRQMFRNNGFYGFWKFLSFTSTSASASTSTSANLKKYTFWKHDCLEAWFFWKHTLVSMSVEQQLSRGTCFLLIFVFWYSPLCFDIQRLDRNGWIELIGLKWLSCNVRIGNRHEHNVGISTRDFEKGSRVEGPWFHQKERAKPTHMRQTAFFARRSMRQSGGQSDSDDMRQTRRMQPP